MSLLEVKNLKIRFDSRRGQTDAVKGIGFEIGDGESVAIVGESGSGKSVTAMSLMRLLPPPPLCTVSGEILLEGQNVYEMDGKTLRAARGGKIAYIFQEPATSFNPLFTIGSQIEEAVKLHSDGSEAPREVAAKSLEDVGIRDARLRLKSYPHEMSGGMLQRAMIAMALACRPKLLVADEPTTALDVTIQKQVIDLLADVRKRRKMSLLLITHNFGIIRHLCERVIVMFRGEIVETGACADVLENPQHPYTKALINCIPRIGHKGEKLRPIDYAKL